MDGGVRLSVVCAGPFYGMTGKDGTEGCPVEAEFKSQSGAAPKICTEKMDRRPGRPKGEPGTRAGPKGLDPWPLVPGSSLRSVRGGNRRVSAVKPV